MKSSSCNHSFPVCSVSDNYPGSFAILKGAFYIAKYPLKNSSIFDFSITLHVFNYKNRFNNYRKALPGDFLWAGKYLV